MTTASPSRLRIVPISFADACAFVVEHHRHQRPPIGMKFCLAVAGDAVHGVAIVGRPVARRMDDGWTLEVNRLCTDGTRNAVSKLRGAISRVAFGLGYQRVITYTLPSEGGGSMRAAGWHLIGERKSGNWNVPSRPRVDTTPELQGQKLLWELTP